MQNVCVITGGGSGMGLETARLMAKKYKVLISGVSINKLEEAVRVLEDEGIDVETMACDVADEDSVGKLVHYATSLGNVTAVIHCAGLMPQLGSTNQIIAINALGTINIHNAFYKVMNNGGYIIDVLSISAYLEPQIIIPKWIYKYAPIQSDLFIKKLEKWVSLFPKKHQSSIAYGISKNFILWFAKQDASRFGAKNVQILSISPL